MKRLTLMILSILLLTGCTTNTGKNDLLIESNESVDKEMIILNETIEDEVVLQTVVPTASPEVKEKDEVVSTSDPEAQETQTSPTPDSTKEPEKVPNNTPQPTKEPAPTSALVVTVEPTVESTPEVVITPKPKPESTPVPTPIPTPVPTPVLTPVSTPEPPKQACPGGYNPDWDCGVRIDKAIPIKLFSVADHGSVEAAFAACDADGQSTNEYNGVEVRSYGCSQQTRNDYGIWGFAIYYMDVNGDIIY